MVSMNNKNINKDIFRYRKHSETNTTFRKPPAAVVIRKHKFWETAD